MSVVYLVLIVGLSVVISWFIGGLAAWGMSAPLKECGFRYRAENLFSRVGGKAVTREQSWKQYAVALLVFNLVMFTAACLILSLQSVLPLNPDGKGPLTPSLIFNTVASFTTNTNLQHYSGEQSLSYFSQLFALMWLQYVSPATGLAVLAAIARGLGGRPGPGNFYRDIMRGTFLVLVPLCCISATLLLFGGVIMTYDGSVVARTLEGAEQLIARGPVAAFAAIKQLGTNGGGFFGPNSTHPFENASFLSNAVETMSLVVIPMASVWMFGRMTGRMKHAAVIFMVMLSLLVVKVSLASYFESAPAAALHGLAVAESPNLEGKELRFGAAGGPAWAAFTTCSSNGSVNAMMDSLNPLTGLVAMVGMWLNVTFGGVGVGMVNMLLYIIVAVFISGMMVGRTPEYLGRKVETREMKFALLAVLAHPAFILGGTALFAATSLGNGTTLNTGFHGFSEILYEFTSSAANNGSGFEGLGDNTTAWNIATGLVMLLNRYLPILLPLAIVASLSGKKAGVETSGSLRTDTFLFGGVLLGCVLFVGALLFLPAAVLGPIADHLSAMATYY